MHVEVRIGVARNGSQRASTSEQGNGSPWGSVRTINNSKRGEQVGPTRSCRAWGMQGFPRLAGRANRNEKCYACKLLVSTLWLLDVCGKMAISLEATGGKRRGRPSVRRARKKGGKA